MRLITGGGTGIGAAIARALAEAGRRRVASRPPQGAARCGGGELAEKRRAIAADVTREADCTAMVAAARAANGPIDIVIANAGMAESAPAGKIDLGHWQRTIDVNLTGAFLTVQRGAGRCHARNARRPHRLHRLDRRPERLPLRRRLLRRQAWRRRPDARAERRTRGQGRHRQRGCPGFTETPLLEASVDKISRQDRPLGADDRAPSLPKTMRMAA